MTEATPPAAPEDAIPQAVALPRRRRNLQLVWLVPALALFIAAVLGVRALVSAGPMITIHFASAEGLDPGKTRIRYKNVDVGVVKTVTLSSDGRAVVVNAQMAKSATKLLVEDTHFWIVRPRFAGGELTGLSTLLSGSYIGVDAGKSEESQSEFVGLATPPSITADDPGRVFTLHSTDIGSIDVDSPVYFRRIQVGKVSSLKVDEDGRSVSLAVFIHSPYERFVSTNTRFWHASGIDVAIDGAGLTLRTQSLLTILLGGIAFGEPDAAPPAAPAIVGAEFTLFSHQALAMKRGDADLTPLLARFGESLRGLSPGAPVDFRGAVIGEVKSVDVSLDTQDKAPLYAVEMVIYRDMLGPRVAASGAGDSKAGGKAGASAGAKVANADAVAVLRRAIAGGLQAQLRTGNLLTGQRYVALDFAKPGARPVKLAGAPGGPLEVPTVSGGLEDLQASLTNIAKSIERVPFERIASELSETLRSVNQILARVDKMPLDELARDVGVALKSLDKTLAGAEKLLKQIDSDLAPSLQATLAEANQTLRSANQLLAGDSPTQQDLRITLRELARTAQAMRELVDVLQRRPESLLRGKLADEVGAAKP